MFKIEFTISQNKLQIVLSICVQPGLYLKNMLYCYVTTHYNLLFFTAVWLQDLIYRFIKKFISFSETLPQNFYRGFLFNH